ncbi:MAG: cation diffusion facilitator family transporter [Oligoflexia bacterium]|nr:cation diffusion facilitator family transporter [Oligoflexia bacterium]
MSKSPQAPHPAHQGMQATAIGIGVNCALALGKMVAGVLGHSFALVADAIESTTDIFSSLITWWGLKVSARPADENHPLGHGKAEPLAATAVAGFLLIAAAMVAYQSFYQILRPHQLPESWTLLVLVGVVCAKGLLSRFALNVADSTGSLAVKGDAWHHRSDALTSAAAFVGIAVAIIGNRLHPDVRWSGADDWAALFSSGIIAFNGLSVLRSAIYELSDAHPSLDLEAQIRCVAGEVEGVVNLHKCYVRKMGFDYYVELDVRVDETLSVAAGHTIAHRVQDAVRANIPMIRFGRVLVHIEPTRVN